MLSLSIYRRHVYCLVLLLSEVGANWPCGPAPDLWVSFLWILCVISFVLITTFPVDLRLWSFNLFFIFGVPLYTCPEIVAETVVAGRVYSEDGYISS